METIKLNVSPFNISISTDIPEVVHTVLKIYGELCLPSSNKNSPIDYNLTICKMNGIRRYIKPQARFFCDQKEPFKPMSLDKAYALLEWGMNWTIAAHEVQHVIVHSAVLAKGDKAIIFPAPPGSGKSTLTSYLAFNGWRLLSDEMAFILPFDNLVKPFVRPICLKNNSIDMAKKWFPDAEFSQIAKDTHKGDVIHLSPPRDSWEKRSENATVVGVVFPKYTATKSLDIYQLDKMEAFSQLLENTFNYDAVAEQGFVTLTSLLEQTKSFEVEYNDLAKVKEFLEEEIIFGK